MIALIGRMIPFIKKTLWKLWIPLIIILGTFINGYKLVGLVLIGFYITFIIFDKRASIYGIIGTMQYSRGNVDEALNWYKKAYKSGKAKTRTKVLYGYLLLKSSSLDEAYEVLNGVTNSKLNNDDMMLAKSNMALVLWKKNKLDKAIEMLEEVIKEYTTSVVYGSLGYMYILKGDMEKALKFNLEAYEYNNNDKIILDNLGQSYYLIGEYDKALEIYEKLMLLKPTFPEAHYNYGLVLLEKNEIQKALDSIKNSLNYKLSFVSTITKEDIESKIKEIEGIYVE